jgi:hypothetical protein
MPGSANFLDDISDDLANWIDSTASSVALAFAPARAPFSANITEDQKLEFYRTRLFSPDGTPNVQGRQEELQRLGPEGFGHVYQAVVKRWPEYRPAEPAPIEVPKEWPASPQGPPGATPAPPGVPPGPPAAPPPGPAGALPPSLRPPFVAPPRPPTPPMVRPIGR